MQKLELITDSTRVGGCDTYVVRHDSGNMLCKKSKRKNDKIQLAIRELKDDLRHGMSSALTSSIYKNIKPRQFYKVIFKTMFPGFSPKRNIRNQLKYFQCSPNVVNDKMHIIFVGFCIFSLWINIMLADHFSCSAKILWWLFLFLVCWSHSFFSLNIDIFVLVNVIVETILWHLCCMLSRNIVLKVKKKGNGSWENWATDWTSQMHKTMW